MCPFISFSLYVAARVFVFHLKIRPKDEQFREALQFLVTALGHIKQKNPLSESFLFQLDLDVAGLIPEGPVMYSSAACSGYPPKQDPLKVNFTNFWIFEVLSYVDFTFLATPN